ncbi:hypothetical protein F7725_019217 [Dissostichus mawsoni]|uniref:GIY-YIG domain-containing protein n=1 Tax=Dissostichus mawsoni TaxID=36200 RepID=A0A7J5YMF9_DISMA|nr:hypothetical protein F7725_019217 [Dissostichus mawsoni]
MVKHASTTFPRASIYIPLINHSPYLTPAQKYNIQLINDSLTEHPASPSPGRLPDYPCRTKPAEPQVKRTEEPEGAHAVSRSSPQTAGHYMIAEDQTIVSGSFPNVVDALMLMFAAYYLSVIAQNWELPWSSCRVIEATCGKDATLAGLPTPDSSSPTLTRVCILFPTHTPTLISPTRTRDSTGPSNKTSPSSSPNPTSPTTGSSPPTDKIKAYTTYSYTPSLAATDNIVYIITCNTCNKHYIGEIKHTILTRLKQHLYNIGEGRLPTPLVTHFQLHPADQLIIPGLETNDRWTVGQRKRAEKLWIEKLGTTTPRGLHDV